jgi:hypothetical protein
MKLKTLACAAALAVGAIASPWSLDAEERDIRPKTGEPALFGTARLPGNRTIGIYGIGPRIVTNYDVSPEEVDTLERVHRGEEVPGYSLSIQDAIGPVEMLRMETPLAPREDQ